MFEIDGNIKQIYASDSYTQKKKSKLFYLNPKLCDLRRIYDLLLKYLLRHTLVCIIIIVAIIYCVQLFSKWAILQTDTVRLTRTDLSVNKNVLKNTYFFKILNILFNWLSQDTETVKGGKHISWKCKKHISKFDHL